MHTEPLDKTESMTWKQRLLMLFTLFLMFLPPGGGLDSTGREFITSFLENRILDYFPVARIYVTSLCDTVTTVFIRVPLLREIPDVTYDLHPGTSVEHEIENSVLMQGSGLQHKATCLAPGEMCGVCGQWTRTSYQLACSVWVQIETSCDVTVQVLEVNQLTADGYLLLPTAALAQEYMVLTYLFQGDSRYSQGPCLVGVTAVEDSTMVQMTLPSADITLVNPVGLASYSDTYILFYLDRFASFQLQSWDDLSGVKVSADKPVAVVVGALWTSVTIDSMGDHLVEMALPTDYWGLEYITVPIAQRTSGDVFRVVASENATVLLYNTTGMVLVENRSLTTGEYVDFDVGSEDVMYLVGSRPVQLAQLCKSNGADPSRYADPFMAMVPSLQQFSGHFSFTTPHTVAVTPSNPDYDHFLNLVAFTSAVRNMTMDGQPISEAPYNRPWTQIPGTPYSYATVNITSGTHVILSNIKDEPIFGGVLYGLKLQESYGMPLGQGMPSADDICLNMHQAGVDGELCPNSEMETFATLGYKSTESPAMESSSSAQTTSGDNSGNTNVGPPTVMAPNPPTTLESTTDGMTTASTNSGAGSRSDSTAMSDTDNLSSQPGYMISTTAVDGDKRTTSDGNIGSITTDDADVMRSTTNDDHYVVASTAGMPTSPRTEEVPPGSTFMPVTTDTPAIRTSVADGLSDISTRSDSEFISPAVRSSLTPSVSAGSTARPPTTTIISVIKDVIDQVYSEETTAQGGNDATVFTDPPSSGTVTYYNPADHTFVEVTSDDGVDDEADVSSGDEDAGAANTQPTGDAITGTDFTSIILGNLTSTTTKSTTRSTSPSTTTRSSEGEEGGLFETDPLIIIIPGAIVGGIPILVCCCVISKSLKAGMRSKKQVAPAGVVVNKQQPKPKEHVPKYKQRQNVVVDATKAASSAKGGW